MNNVHGHCVCGAVEVILKEYGEFVYTCHCDTCRRLNAGPIISVDPGPQDNVVFARGEEKITRYQDEEVQRGFCSVCGTTLFWHDPAADHYCMNAELFDEVIRQAAFGLELFYDMKPAYYDFAGARKRLDRNFQEV